MKRKWVFALGVAVCIGMVFWLRELASWRPVTIAKLPFAATQLLLSRDGKQLWVEKSHTRRGVVIEMATGTVAPTAQGFFGFKALHDLETFPRVTEDQGEWQLSFSPLKTRTIVLAHWKKNVEFYAAHLYAQNKNFEDRIDTGLSKQRKEIYAELEGVVWIWDWNGNLKKKVRYGPNLPRSAVFSADGKWLLASEESSSKRLFLRRYDLQNGKPMEILNRGSMTSRFGFSPDGRWIWFIRDNASGNPLSFHAAPVSNSRTFLGSIWSQDCSGPAKWLSDGRIGIVRESGFEWRLASGRLFRRLPGPIQDNINPNKLLVDWTLSPDGKWIYSCERSGVIRRWRAR